MGSKNSIRSAVALLTVAAVVVATSAAAQDGTAADLLKRVRDTVPKVAFAAKAKLSSDRGWVRELELSHKQVNGVAASYLEVTAPMDLKDTRFLLLDRETGRDDQFIYVPSAKRSIQVGAQTRKQAFLGSEFYVGDLVQPELDGFTYSFVGQEDVNGRHCKLVESVPKSPADEIYGKSILAIDPNDLLVLRTQLFDQTGKLQKVWTIDKIEKVDGYWTPLVQQMADVLENHWSKLELSEIKYNAPLTDDMFTRSYLAR